MTTERLQSAIAKARAERRAAAPEAANAPPERSRPAAAPATATKREAAPAAWDEIPAVEVDPRRLRAKRILSVEGGPEATPFDVLRTRLLQRMSENGWRRVAITSPSPGCGKSTIALNLAFGIARQPQRRVLSVEADLRRPSHESLLGLGHGDRSVAGLFEGRTRFADCAFRPRDNLAMAVSSDSVRNASDILLAEEIGDRLRRVETDYAPDVMLFDMPPLMVNDDTQAFLKHVDCAVLVGAAGETTTAELDQCERLIAQTTSVAGIVLNKSRYSTEGRYDAYDYY